MSPGICATLLYVIKHLETYPAGKQQYITPIAGVN